MPLILLTLVVFHFDTSGKDDNDLHLENKLLILITLFISHFDKSGRDNNDLQLENILLIS